MAEKVYRFWHHCQGEKKSRDDPTLGLNLCPGNGTRPALRSLLSVALSSVRVCKFYHFGCFSQLDGFSM